MTFKKIIGKSILLAGSAFLLAACGNNSSEEIVADSAEDRYELDATTPAWQLDTKEEVTELTWYVNADWWNDSWGEDIVTEKDGRRFKY